MEWFEYVKPILEVLIPIASLALAAFITKLLPGIIKIFADKTKMQVSAREQEWIQNALVGGIALAEQKGLSAVKQKKEIPDSVKKMQIAVNYFKAQAKEMGYDKIPEDRIEDWVEIVLAQLTKYKTSETDLLATDSSKYRVVASLDLPYSGEQFFMNGKNSA